MRLATFDRGKRDEYGGGFWGFFLCLSEELRVGNEEWFAVACMAEGAVHEPNRGRDAKSRG
jgi:hypothetical protein